MLLGEANEIRGTAARARDVDVPGKLGARTAVNPARMPGPSVNCRRVSSRPYGAVCARDGPRPGTAIGCPVTPVEAFADKGSRQRRPSPGSEGSIRASRDAAEVLRAMHDAHLNPEKTSGTSMIAKPTPSVS